MDPNIETDVPYENFGFSAEGFDVDTNSAAIFHQHDADFVKTMDQSVWETLQNVVQGVATSEIQDPLADSVMFALTADEKSLVDKFFGDPTDFKDQASRNMENVETVSSMQNMMSCRYGSLHNERRTRHHVGTETSHAGPAFERPLAGSVLSRGSCSMQTDKLKCRSCDDFGVDGQVIQETTVQCSPVLDNALLIRTHNETEKFYCFVYRQFELTRAYRGRHPNGAGCRRVLGSSMLERETILTKANVSNCLRRELLAGTVLSEKNMEIYAGEFVKAGKYKYLCPSCDSLFKDEVMFEQHMTRLDNGRLMCPYVCGNEPVRFRTLLSHLKTRHRTNRTKPLQGTAHKFQERYCGRTFASKIGLASHSRQAHDDGKRTCRFCKTVMADKNELDNHVLVVHRIHSGMKLQFPCDVEGCTGRFATERGLNSHKAVAHKIYDEKFDCFFRCKVKGCTRKFKTDDGLIRHMDKQHW